MFDLTFDKLQLFLWVGLPGVIALKVYDLLCPPAKRDFGASLIEIVTYSLLNLALWSWAVIPLNRDNFPKEHPVVYALCVFPMLVLSAAVMAWGLYRLRTSKWARGLDHPTPTGWDWFLQHEGECWMLFHLKSGQMLGGYFGPGSLASSYPQEPEVYVQEVWRVDEHGRFIEKVEGTKGMVIRLVECERVEFLNVESDDVQKGDDHGEAGRERRDSLRQEARENGGTQTRRGDSESQAAQGWVGDRTAPGEAGRG